MSKQFRFVPHFPHESSERTNGRRYGDLMKRRILPILKTLSSKLVLSSKLKERNLSPILRKMSLKLVFFEFVNSFLLLKNKLKNTLSKECV